MAARPFLVLFLAVPVGAAAIGSIAAEEAVPAGRIEQLVRSLGSVEYTLREAATEELARIGLPAYSALDAASRHPDREIRYRSRRVLGIIRNYDQERRLQAFVTGQDAGGPPLAGW